MTATILIAAAMMAQPVTVSATMPGAERVDVAYEQIAAGRPLDAIERIGANTSLDADDPAALINLGAAYAMLGNTGKANECYRSAIASEARYDLQLADGSWMDSRRAARKAAEALTQGKTLALR